MFTLTETDSAIILCAPSELKPYEGNARLHDEKQIAAIMASIKESGFTAAIIINKENMVLTGHGQLVDAESTTVIGAYERNIDDLERQKLILAEKRARCGTAIKDYDESFRTALEFLSNPWNLWEKGAFEDMRIVLKLTLASHLEYDWNEGVRTSEITLPFKVLQADSCREVMAERSV